MKYICKFIIGLLAIAGFIACEEKPVVEDVKFSVYDDSGSTPKTVNFLAKGKKAYPFKIMSNAEWSLVVAEGAEWITATPSSGPSGMRPVSVDVATNETTSARSGRIDFTCKTVKISIAITQDAGEKKPDDVVVPPADPSLPQADLLDVVFMSDGTAIDNSAYKFDVQYIKGSSSVNYFNDIYQRYVSHYTHKLGESVAGGYYKVDYTSEPAFKEALADGHTMEVVFRMDQAANGKEIKPFSSMQAGGTGFLITATGKGTDITFLPNVSTDGKSNWIWTQSGIVPEVGKYYHVVGIWDKTAGKAYIYVNGELKKEMTAAGSLNFPSSGNTWFCIGADPSGNTAHSGFNGDVVLARIYDEPLKTTDVNNLYQAVKNDVKGEVFGISNLSYLSNASVTKGCWYYIYADGFKSGDILTIESIIGTKTYTCKTVYSEGLLKLQIPEDFMAGDYRLVLNRGESQYPIGYASFKIVNELKPVGKTQVVAHRGYHPGNVAENSMASLIEAQKLGVYGSEFDVYVTTDDVVVLYHDSTFKGTEHADNEAFKGTKVYSYTYDQIKDYKLINGECIPTLNQYLEQGLKYPNTKLILEIKSHANTAMNMKAAEACFKAVKAKGMQDQVEYIAFNYDICKKLVELDPNAMVQYLNGDKTPSAVLADGIRGIDYNSGKLTETWIQEANALGMTVNVWTVNAESQMVDFMNKGVDLITTDESELALRVLSKPFVSNE